MVRIGDKVEFQNYNVKGVLLRLWDLFTIPLRALRLTILPQKGVIDHGRKRQRKKRKRATTIKED
jgi:hypothetical protein